MATVKNEIFNQARIEDYETTAEFVDDVKALLKSAHTFEKEESDGNGGVKLYYTNSSYIKIAVSNTVSYGINKIYLAVSNDDFTRVITPEFNKAAWQLIKSKNGDVIIRIGADVETPLTDAGWNVGTLFKGKSAITGEELWALSVPYGIPGQSGNSYDPFYIVTDDTEDMSGANGNTGSDGAGSIVRNTSIYNSNSKITVLAPLFAVSSEYISQYTYTMRIAPTTYTGACTLNGQQFYCYGLLAMLDE